MPDTSTRLQSSRATIDAKAFVLDPVAASERPAKRLTAWAILKGTRGQSLSQTNLRRIMDDQGRARQASSTMGGAA